MPSPHQVSWKLTLVDRHLSTARDIPSLPCWQRRSHIRLFCLLHLWSFVSRSVQENQQPSVQVHLLLVISALPRGIALPSCPLVCTACGAVLRVLVALQVHAAS